MPVNLEIKARLSDPESSLLKAEELQVNFKEIRSQKDTYFNCRAGRLKLRECPGLEAELIYYVRDETGLIRRSDYQVYKFPPDAGLGTILKTALPVIGVVTKKRHIYIHNNARIHIDDVQNLGWFIEFEVPVLTDKAIAEDLIENLIRIFGVRSEDLIKASYLDMLLSGD